VANGRFLLIIQKPRVRMTEEVIMASGMLV